MCERARIHPSKSSSRRRLERREMRARATRKRYLVRGRFYCYYFFFLCVFYGSEKVGE